jgi:ribonuclease-3 family protein
MDNSELRNFAYLGDAVWELFIRKITISQTTNPKELHSITIKKVNAGFQAKMLEILHDKISIEEQELIRRARNLPVPIARRHNQAEYRQATAFEAIIGFWYSNDKERLFKFLEILQLNF